MNTDAVKKPLDVADFTQMTTMLGVLQDSPRSLSRFVGDGESILMYLAPLADAKELQIGVKEINYAGAPFPRPSMAVTTGRILFMNGDSIVSYALHERAEVEVTGNSLIVRIRLDKGYYGAGFEVILARKGQPWVGVSSTQLNRVEEHPQKIYLTVAQSIELIAKAFLD